MEGHTKKKGKREEDELMDGSENHAKPDEAVHSFNMAA